MIFPTVSHVFYIRGVFSVRYPKRRLFFIGKTRLFSMISLRKVQKNFNFQYFPYRRQKIKRRISLADAEGMGGLFFLQNNHKTR